ncbi:MAG: hypothetical protein ABI743_11715 [bacterium]
MTLPASAELRWITASVIKHLNATLPDLPLLIGPVFDTPAVLPALILQRLDTTTTSFLDQRTSITSNQRGIGLTVRYWLGLVAEPSTWQVAGGALLDRLRVACATGSIPWESESEAGTVITEGALRVQWHEGEGMSRPGWLKPLLAARNWEIASAEISVSALLQWPEGVTP